MQRRFLFLFLLLVISIVNVFSENITIRLAYNNIPPGSAWLGGLEKLSKEWKKVTNGQVTLKIMQNQGDETILLQKINSQKLEAVIFDSAAVKTISPEAFSLSLPSLIQSDSELDVVLEKLHDYLQLKLEGRKSPSLVPVDYIKAGWIYLFSKDPIRSPDDLKAQKLIVNSNQSDIPQLWISLGFKIDTTPGNMLTKIQSGQIDAFYMNAYGSLVIWSSIQQKIKYMSDMKLAPILGFLLIEKETWYSISEENRSKIKAATRKICLELEAETMRDDNKKIAELKEKGLIVVSPSASDKVLWENKMKDAMAKGLGTVFPKEMLEKVTKILTELRKK